MSLAIIQAGSNLQLLSANGDLTTLTLPTNVTLRTDVPPRWVIYSHYAVLVNTPSQPLTIDANGTVRLLTPRPPRVAPVLSAGVAGTLTGSYRTKMTFVIQDALGNVIAESDYSPFSNQFAITNKKLRASNLDLSPDEITGRRLYRTTTLGAVYFQWVDLDGNILTAVEDDLSDAGLSLVAAPTLGTPPRLTLIAEFRGRLFGVGDVDIDHVRYTEAGIQYAWPSDNTLEIPSVGMDAFGIVSLLPRREALGAGRRNMLVQITGTGTENSSGIVDFDVVILSKELGVESQESMVVFRDTAYFLWKDGVYTWGSEGLRCISDGTEGKSQVRSWFTTNSYFNRDRFPYAFAEIDPNRPIYRLFLADADSDVENAWVEYDIKDGTWWGPHSTALFTPTSAFNRTNASNRTLPVIGSASDIWTDQETRSDTSTRETADLTFVHATGILDPRVYAAVVTADLASDRDVPYLPSFDEFTIINGVTNPRLWFTYDTAGVGILGDLSESEDFDLTAATTALVFDVIGKRHDLGVPDLDKFFGQISLYGKAQASGELDIIARVGEANATTEATHTYDMTQTRQRLGRIGTGKHAQLELVNEEAGIDVELYGYEIAPVHVLGRR